MKVRILNNRFAGIYTDIFIVKNFNKIINSEFVSEWELTEILPSENLLNPFWNGTEWTEYVSNSGEVTEKPL